MLDCSILDLSPTCFVLQSPRHCLSWSLGSIAKKGSNSVRNYLVFSYMTVTAEKGEKMEKA